MGEKAKHTPGPWSWDGNWLGVRQGTCEYSMILAYTTDDDGLCGSEADKALVAAAPDLLEALEAVLHAEIIYTGAIKESIATCGMDSITRLKAMIEAAISKARG